MDTEVRDGGMRPIKFRAWDTGHKKMWSAEEMGADELTINPDGRGFVNVHSASAQLSHYMPHMIPLQFTGLLDKNGKEIYDGDIVRWDHIAHKEDCGTHAVIFDQGQFRLADPGSYPLENLVNFELLGGFIEVVGNIHENPELLK